MNRKVRYHFTKLIFPGISIGLLLYFLYHILSGDHGLIAWRSLESQLKEEQKNLSLLEAQQKQLKNKVKRLNSETLDPELVDERIRLMLNKVQDNEIIIIDEGV